MRKDGYPDYICDDCGTRYGKWYSRGVYTGPEQWYATYHHGTCEICKTNNVPVTEPRDFGGLKRPLTYLSLKITK